MSHTRIVASSPVTAEAEWPTLETRADLLRTPAWVVQYDPVSAAALQEDWDSLADEQFDEEGLVETPDISRHLDKIKPGDFILFWVFGAGNKAGIYAWGNASGDVSEDDFPKRWSEPDGPMVRKTCMDVHVGDVFEEPFLTRTVLLTYPEFENFELFRMPNRPNAFAVTPAQWSIILDHLTNAR